MSNLGIHLSRINGLADEFSSIPDTASNAQLLVVDLNLLFGF